MIPDEIYRALFPSVGSLVICWSLLEQSVESWVALIYHAPGGNVGYKKIPFMLNAKLTFLRERFTDLAALQSFSQEGLRLLNEVERLSKIRDILVHGAISDFDEATGRLKFVRLGIDKADNMHQAKDDHLTLHEILEAGNAIVDVNAATLEFGSRLMGHLSAPR
jgi:hypothetical protein